MAKARLSWAGFLICSVIRAVEVRFVGALFGMVLGE